jgi:hypothetical protein
VGEKTGRPLHLENIGRRFGRLVAGVSGAAGSVWRFRCDCGTIHEAVRDLKEAAKLLIEDKLQEFGDLQGRARLYGPRSGTERYPQRDNQFRETA